MSVVELWSCLQKVVRGSAFECLWVWFDQSGSLGLDGRVDAVADALYRIVDTSFCFGGALNHVVDCAMTVLHVTILIVVWRWSRSRKRRGFVR